MGDHAKFFSTVPTKKISDFYDDDSLPEIITEWMTPILIYDMPPNTHAVSFDVIKTARDEWSMCLQGFEIIDDKNNIGELNYRMLYTSSMTYNRLNWESKVEFAEGIEKLERVISRIMEGDNKASALLKQYKKVGVSIYP